MGLLSIFRSKKSAPKSAPVQGKSAPSKKPLPPPPPPVQSIKGRVFRPVEVFLLSLSIAFLLGSFALYFAEVPLRKLILGWDEEEVTLQIGTLGQHQGALLRQLHNATEFLSITSDAPLFNFDTVMTSSAGSATLVLRDGGRIELGPDTLVKLQFDTQLAALGGSGGTNKVEVISGTVRGQAGAASKLVLKNQGKEIQLSQELSKPIVVERPNLSLRSSAPAALALEVRGLNPPNGSSLQLETISEPLQRPVRLEWNTNVPDTPVEVILRRAPAAQEVTGEEIFRRVISSRGNQGSTLIGLRKPGNYEWEIADIRGIPLKGGPVRSRFSISPELRMIEALPSLLAGRPIGTPIPRNESLKDPKITFRWKPIPKIDRYLFKLSNQPDLGGKPLLQQEVRDDHIDWKDENIIGRRFFYRIEAPLGAGFFVTSQVNSFSIPFNAPVQVYPQDKASISRRSLRTNDNSILLTWQKTAFATGYEIEIAAEPRFSTRLANKSSPENFYLFPVPRKTRFWWRVRATTKALKSPWSTPAEVAITP